MTVITLNTAQGRLSLEQRRASAETLTDAVLVPKVGLFAPADLGQGSRCTSDWRQGVRAEVGARVLAASARSLRSSTTRADAVG